MCVKSRLAEYFLTFPTSNDMEVASPLFSDGQQLKIKEEQKIVTDGIDLNGRKRELPRDIKLARIPEEKLPSTSRFELSDLNRIFESLSETLEYTMTLEDITNKGSTKDILYVLENHPDLKSFQWKPTNKTFKNGEILFCDKNLGNSSLSCRIWHFTQNMVRHEKNITYSYIIEFRNEKLNTNVPIAEYPKFDRSKCKPSLVNDIAEIVPFQVIEITVKNFVPGLLLQTFPPVTQPIRLDSPTKLFSLTPFNNYFVNLLLMKIPNPAPIDKITFKFVSNLGNNNNQLQPQISRILPTAIQPTNSLYPYVNLHVDPVSRDFDIDIRGAVLPMMTNTPLRIYLEQLLGVSNIISYNNNNNNNNNKNTNNTSNNNKIHTDINNNSSKNISPKNVTKYEQNHKLKIPSSSNYIKKSVMDPIIGPTKQIKKGSSTTRTTVTEPNRLSQCATPYNDLIKTIYLTELMQKRLCGTIIVELYIRTKRRGPWEYTNFEPTKIGKMRKVEVHFRRLSKPLFVTATSSNTTAVILSLSEKIPIDGPGPICSTISPNIGVEPECDCVFSFYLLPTRARGETTISIFAKVCNSSTSSPSESSDATSESFLLQAWKLNVAGHKYESSKTGRRLSVTNIKKKIIPLIYPPINGNIDVPTCFASVPPPESVSSTSIPSLNASLPCISSPLISKSTSTPPPSIHKSNQHHTTRPLTPILISPISSNYANPTNKIGLAHSFSGDFKLSHPQPRGRDQKSKHELRDEKIKSKDDCSIVVESLLHLSQDNSGNEFGNNSCAEILGDSDTDEEDSNKLLRFSGIPLNDDDDQYDSDEEEEESEPEMEIDSDTEDEVFEDTD